MKYGGIVGIKKLQYIQYTLTANENNAEILNYLYEFLLQSDKFVLQVLKF